MRVEDARLFGADLARREEPDVLDLVAYLGHGLLDATPLGGGIADRVLVDLQWRGGQLTNRSDADAWRRRKRPGQGRRRWGRRYAGRIAGLAEAPPGEVEQVIDRFLRLRTDGA